MTSTSSSSPPPQSTNTMMATTDYYYATSRSKNTPSPMIVFPASSPTPKLSCNTPSKKPTSPFDWAKECFLDDQQEAITTSDWDHHFDEMERIGKEIERDSLALERLREKANPTPEERCVLSWINSSSPSSSSPSSTSQLSSRPLPPLPSPSNTNDVLSSSSSSSSSSLRASTKITSTNKPLFSSEQQRQEKPATSFLAFLNRFKKSLKLQ